MRCVRVAMCKSGGVWGLECAGGCGVEDPQCEGDYGVGVLRFE